MKEITIIIPIHEFNAEVKAYLNKAMNSIDKNIKDIMFVGPKEVIEAAAADYEDIDLVYNEDTDFYTQINTAVMQCVTEYFSILEFDDTYYPNWYENVQKDDSSPSVLLTINEYFKDEKFVSFGNEIAWDASFIDNEMGHITEGELKIYKDFNVTGGIIKTEDFITVGKLNPEYKLVAWYEFLMRCARSEKTIYVIPRVCYAHTVMRNGSYMSKAAEIMNAEEFTKRLNDVVGTEEEKQD